MRIFSTTISFKIEDIHYYYLCKYTHNVFKEKKDKSHNLMVSKNSRENEIIIIFKDCCDLSY